MKRMNSMKEEELLKRQEIERRALPKRIRSEMKTRELMFRESLRISMANFSTSSANVEEERDKLKRFQESEKQRYKAEHIRQEQKHKKQLEELKDYSVSLLHELEQIHKDKKKDLMERETLKLKILEDEHLEEVKQWKSHLKPRKQVSFPGGSMFWAVLLIILFSLPETREGIFASNRRARPFLWNLVHG